MNIIKADLTQPIILGRQGEHGVTQVLFDLSWYIKTYGDGVAQLTVKRPGDPLEYMGVVTRDGTTAVWEIGAEWTEIHGQGYCYLHWHVDNDHAKTDTYKTMVYESRSACDAPEPQKGYLDRIVDAGLQAVKAEERAKSHADTVQETAKRFDETFSGVVQTAEQNAVEANAQAQRAAAGAKESAEGAARSEQNAGEHRAAAETAEAGAKEAEQGALAAAERAEQAAAKEGAYAEQAGEFARDAGAANESAQTAAGSAQASAENAAASEQTVKESADNAAVSEANARASAENAAASKKAASEYKAAAETAETGAKEAEQGALSAAERAELVASKGGAYAEEAGAFAQEAGSASTQAQQAAANASQSANSAAASEQAAAEHRVAAENAETKAKGYTANPPVIGDNGNWWIWDGSQYVDSGNVATDKLTMRQGNTLYSNALKGMVSGAAIRMYDVSPLEHIVPVKVSSKNLYFNNETKSVTVQGTLTLETTTKTSDFVLNGATTIEYAMLLSRDIPLKAGTYTVSVHGTNIIGSQHDRIYVSAASGVLVNDVRNGSPQTLTLAEDTIVSVRAILAAGTTYENATCSVQIEQGTTATDYSPYVDPTTATLRTCGKNLSPVTSIDTTVSVAGAISITDAREIGTYTLSAKVTKYPDDTATNTRVSATVYYTSGEIQIFESERDTASAENDGVQRLKTVTFTPYTHVKIAYIQVLALDCSSAGKRHAKAEEIQLEYASSVTTFEECRGSTYAPVEDGTCEVISIAPTMTLTTDTDGVLLECEYNRDINKAFEQLTQAILSMGGNI